MRTNRVPMETYLPIANYPDYEVSNAGNIRSKRVSPEWRQRKMFVGRDGYARVILCGDNGNMTRYVHRLVAGAFIDNPEGLSDVDHINGDKADNRAENLRWVTHAKNLELARERLGNWVLSGADSPVSKEILVRASGSDEWVPWVSARAWAIASGKANRAAGICNAIQTGRMAFGHYWKFAKNDLPRSEVGE